ncbi:sulfur transferase domain-containing protein [Stenotrophomonas sp. MH1]|uniref:Sulfur transferase domain-containing protein n=1 Tax=Stenotrophomonas capsici TaxID=3110230 RepID=A0ABU5UYM8_9GAMM|nr:sulfur transferase domain-containing protein [Stenotrophomonas sp. MH1]MEA5666151.1 sulfur transferase domain-containing protein [Stenotrophomonas sp. MH1]
MTGFRSLLLLAVLASANAMATDAPLRQPRPQLLTAGQPSAQQLRDAARSGVTTVIDLRRPEEDRGYDEGAQAEQLGLRYVRLPIAGAADLTTANARTLQRLLTQDDGTTLLHCASGNRAGALLALLNARLEGAPTDDALQLGRAAGMTSLEASARSAIEATVP